MAHVTQDSDLTFALLLVTTHFTVFVQELPRLPETFPSPSFFLVQDIC